MARAIVLAGLEQTDQAKEGQPDYASMQSALAANSVNNNELGTKVSGEQ